MGSFTVFQSTFPHFIAQCVVNQYENKRRAADIFPMVTWVIWQLYEWVTWTLQVTCMVCSLSWVFSIFNDDITSRSGYFSFEDGTPHQTINAIKEQLKGLGYSISSPDNFENSLRCDTCQVTLKFQKSFQAVWLLRGHTREKAHQVKAGWILDDENNVQRSKPKGKFKSSRIKCSWTGNNYPVLCYIQRVGQPLNHAVRWQAVWSLVNCVQTS